LLVTRSRPDAAAMQERLEAAGHRVTVEPLISIEPIDAGPLELAGVQALVATSRNAVRAVVGVANFSVARCLPLIVVGPGTADEAHRIGFARIAAGPAAASDLLEVVKASLDPTAGALLHLAGETVAFDLAAGLSAAGFDTRQQVVYRANPRARFTRSAEQLLREGAIDAVTLMSPRTAAVYAELAARHELGDAIAAVAHLCLSATVSARLAPLGPVVVEIAGQPNLEEMLALVARVAAQSRP
ncbi:MAG: uroporphyrinogen-III synthase, partial [Pyrinomonadaceae bacterium]